jgi:membrane protein DedA with SNARE-associated domain
MRSDSQETYWLIFLAVFAEQAGIPLPSAPVLIAAGTLAADGRISAAAAIGISLVASLLADSSWYALGRRYGTRVLGTLCRISIEPDSCVRTTLDRFTRNGAWLIPIAKFIPGLGTVAPPLAGVVGIGLPRFLLFDSAGFLGLVVALMSAGYVFRGPLGHLGQALALTGWWVILPIATVILAYLGWKYARRRRVLIDLDIPRVTPADLKTKLDAGEAVAIVDLRHSVELGGEPWALPGALRMQPHELEERDPGLAPDRDIVLYCA